MKTEAQLRPAVAEDRPAIRRLLTAAGLPTDDLERAPMEFVVALSGGEVIGVAGAERLAPHTALLRSFAVAPSHRRQGIAGAMLVRLLSDGAGRGVTGFYLLTVTAAPFFAARGFTTLSRDEAPSPVRDHPQFAGLCPASAVLMHFAAEREGV
jgi:amino-acid N-acetyltransferase